jgi:hypothetical protein
VEVNSATPWKIAVVGGSAAEPELAALTALGMRYFVTTYGLDQANQHIDLNDPPSEEVIADESYDLVLSSQVIEHLWNHASYFSWLSRLACSGAYLWVGAPAANRPHASPDYFAAGFTNSYLARNLEISGFSVIDSGMLGSQRLYNGALAEDEWLSVEEHRRPLLNRQSLSSLNESLHRMRKLPRLARLAITDGRMSSDERFAVESWVWARSIA